MKKLLPVLLLLCSLSAFGKSPRDKAIEEVAKAERDFAKMSVDQGARPAFFANFTEDGMSFAPAPIPMRQLFGPAPPPNTQRKNKLDWYPIWTDASESGDLALSTGPTVTSELATGKALRWGNFASVWKKQGDGSWKVIVDMGAPHAEPPNPETQWKAGKATGFKAKNINVEQEAQKLAEFEKTAFRGTSAADSYAKVLTDESRLHREGVFPVKGKPLIVDHLSKSGVQNVAFEPQKTEVASSGDIAYTYGAYTLQPGDKKGYYVHFWKREKNGDWKMVLDVANAEEEEKK